MKNEDRLPLSYVGQYYYCPRRAALLMNQQIWEENEYTAEGRLEHERVHTGRVERRGDFLKLYEFSVWSDTLMLSGKCDCIEAKQNPNGAELPAEKGRYALYPIEYKHGKVRHEKEYELQLCAQAICLEEMYHTVIPEGALFYIDAHQRIPIEFTEELRILTRNTTEFLWDCFHENSLPAAVETAKCLKCSLKENCMPGLHSSASAYCRRLRRELQEEVP